MSHLSYKRKQSNFEKNLVPVNDLQTLPKQCARTPEIGDEDAEHQAAGSSKHVPKFLELPAEIRNQVYSHIISDVQQQPIDRILRQPNTNHRESQTSTLTPTAIIA
jgi:hypothetical protein